ncbi:MAG TPA: LCP family protein, partial [Patescibacteria group bacterium]|nr:LCP family protein [Patescibacteria group bacterium]
NMGGVIKNVTGLPTDYFVSVDFGGFIKLIDNLGGVTVNVPKTFDDPLYPITGLENETCGKTEDEINALKAKYSDYQLETQFTCRYEHLHFDKGLMDLDGKTALKFVRSRHGDSDFGRSERQFAVLKGILAKLITLHSFDKTNSTIDTLSKIVRTNLNIDGIRNFVDLIGPTSDYKITDIHLTLDNVLNEGKSAQGAYILIPKAGMLDFSGIKGYINANIN